MFTLNGFTPEQIADIEAELRMGWDRKAVVAELRRREIAEMNKEETFWRDDWRVEMRMDPLVALYWKMREGLDVWQDSFHKGYFKKHFPEVFTNQKSGKMQHGYRGGSTARSTRPASAGLAQGESPAGDSGALVDRVGRPIQA